MLRSRGFFFFPRSPELSGPAVKRVEGVETGGVLEAVSLIMDHSHSLL